ncbi:MAG: hypothetical protein Dasosvirus4_11 [Dasosvirus sp.]|uniref:Endonuclease/exonuclease/phosphatase domain-containing protein n=1 Tax=Dasosvirus sp. TaxID=2487764 RepID=A0A3G4ZRF7_9VIRU|nr:MAG: hypothetical protein Dasosvirus4_11 [Dasosvirus sp.]
MTTVPDSTSAMTQQSDDYLSLSFGNLANASNDEKSENYRYAQREDMLHKTISEMKTDSFCALEFRVCSNKSKTRKLQPEELGVRLSKNTGLSLATLKPQNLDYMAFWRGTFYNKNKLRPLQSFARYAINPVFGSTVVSERGVMLLFTQYEEKQSKKQFWVINTHMPIAQKEKMIVVKWFNDNAVKECQLAGDKNPLIILGGDMNTFFDDGGQDMMDLFSEQWIHLTGNLKKTFKSFPQDPVQTTSQLDHIFVNKQAVQRIKIIKPATATFTDASDHAFLTIFAQLV